VWSPFTICLFAPTSMPSSKSNSQIRPVITFCIQVTFLAANFLLKSSKRAWNNVISLVLRSYTKISSSNSVCKVIPESS
jgi:hypothetical protein